MKKLRELIEKFRENRRKRAVLAGNVAWQEEQEASLAQRRA